MQKHKCSQHWVTPKLIGHPKIAIDTAEPWPKSVWFIDPKNVGGQHRATYYVGRTVPSNGSHSEGEHCYRYIVLLHGRQKQLNCGCLSEGAHWCYAAKAPKNNSWVAVLSLFSKCWPHLKPLWKYSLIGFSSSNLLSVLHFSVCRSLITLKL